MKSTALEYTKKKGTERLCHHSSRKRSGWGEEDSEQVFAQGKNAIGCEKRTRRGARWSAPNKGTFDPGVKQITIG